MVKITKGIDWIILFSMILLMLLGIFMIYSASTIKQGDTYLTENFYAKQFEWMMVSIVALFVIFVIPYPILESFIIPAYILSVVLLIFVLFSHPINGSRRWLDIKFFKFQVSDFAKFSTILLLSKLLSEKFLMTYKLILRTTVVIPPLILIMLEPDLGTSMIFLFVLFAILSVSDLPAIYLILAITPFISMVTSFVIPIFLIYILFLVFILIKNKFKTITISYIVFANLLISFFTPFFWNHLKNYQRNRILTFLEPSRDPFGSGYQIIQAKIAIGSGGFFGKGFLLGTQKNLNFLPEHHTDFIFSVIGEEFGFFGCLFLLALYFLFLFRIFMRLKDLKRRGKRFIAVGILAYLTFQMFINIGMNIGIVPTTGIPLPFISYGGTNLLINVIAVGLILKFIKERSIFE